MAANYASTLPKPMGDFGWGPFPIGKYVSIFK